MITAVFDTNVLVSASCLPQSLPAHLVRFWLSQAFEMVLSDGILREFNDVMRRPKIRNRYMITDEAVAAFSDAFAAVALVLPSTDIPDAVPGDSADNHVIGCAVQAKANFIVSGDRHLLELGYYGGISIVTPAAFLAELQVAGIA
jgi:putative PIN family toxin of toxin-antitoxin system